MESQDAPKSRYLPQIDGARAVAVILVCLHHFGIHPSGGWDWGPIGPTVFFMLSGYLVTRSCLSLREKEGRWGDLLHFHIRRFSRLLPVLYIMIGIGAILGFTEFSDHWLWHLSLATNFLIVSQNDWTGATSHLWSLGVQEQFYVLWPFVMLLVPKKHLTTTVLAFVVVAVSFRLACIAGGVSPFIRWFMLPGSMDTFAFGSLVALWAGRAPAFSSLQKIIIGVVACACFATSSVMRFVPQESLWVAFVEIPENLFFAWVLFRLLDSASWPSAVLRWGPLAAVGRLGYGIYIFHTLIAVSFAAALSRVGLEFSQLGTAVILIGLSIAAAAASFYLVERPIIHWSRTFRPAIPAHILALLRRLGNRPAGS